MDTMRYKWDSDTMVYSGEDTGEPGPNGSTRYLLNSTAEAPPEAPSGKVAMWTGAGWEIRVAPTMGDLRNAAYEREADPIRAKADGLKDRAEVLASLGRGDDAAEALAEAERILREEWWPKIQEIKGRYPDPQYYLTAAGTYHRDGCSYTTAAGEWLDLQGIAVKNPAARACSRCEPPALGQEGNA